MGKLQKPDSGKFSILHRAQRALRDMELVRYEGDIEKYLLTLENLNIDAEMSGWHGGI